MPDLSTRLQRHRRLLYSVCHTLRKVFARSSVTNQCREKTQGDGTCRTLGGLIRFASIPVAIPPQVTLRSLLAPPSQSSLQLTCNSITRMTLLPKILLRSLKRSLAYVAILPRRCANSRGSETRLGTWPSIDQATQHRHFGGGISRRRATAMRFAMESAACSRGSGNSEVFGAASAALRRDTWRSTIGISV